MNSLEFFSAPTPYPFAYSKKECSVYAIDCQMCFTVHGIEISKETGVVLGGDIVYGSFVRPESDITDFKARFSVNTVNDITNETKSLRDVQNDIMGFITSERIVIDHGLENDLDMGYPLYSAEDCEIVIIDKTSSG